MVHIIQNDLHVPPGTICEHLESMGILYCIHHPYLGDPLPDPRDISALIVMGGAMGANDDASHPFLTELKKFIRTIVKEEIPYLGICLGGQLLAAALGARVESNRWEELGTLPVTLTGDGRSDLLFQGIDTIFNSFQWHHDSFDLPDGALLLASSPACPHQAFRIGERAWGTQFHPEVTAGIIRDWCSWSADTKARTDELVNEWHEQAASYNHDARRMLINFMRSSRLAHLVAKVELS